MIANSPGLMEYEQNSNLIFQEHMEQETENRHENASILITGASSGIGEACAIYLDQLGFRVFAAVRKEEDGQRLRFKASDRLVPILLDVTDSASITAAKERINQILGDKGLHGLVNNAGIANAGPIEFLPLDVIERQFQVNVFGQIQVTQAFIPLLRKAKGRIVNMGSISGLVAKPFAGLYSASKFALEGFNSSLRMEMMPWGIMVSIIEPGGIATPIWEKSVQEANQLMQKSLPAQTEELYGPALRLVEKTVVKLSKEGIPAQEVVIAVADALTSDQPKSRYVVGKAAKTQAFLTRFLPAPIMDQIIMKKMGLDKPPKQFQTFKEFYPFYLGEHANKTCRRLHFIGSSGVLLTLLYTIFTQNWWTLLLLPVIGYGFAWIGHFVFEKNRPATFTYPMFSLLGDWVMYKDILTGKIKF